MSNFAPASRQRTLFTNIRLLDVANGYDGDGYVLVEGASIVASGAANPFPNGVPDDVTVISGNGACCAAGLVDMRAQLAGENQRHKETLRGACDAAVAGGITTLVCSAESDPILDSTHVIDALVRRGREIGLASVLAYGALTKGLEGQELTEIGMLQQAGCLGFMDGNHTLANAKLMQRAMKYVSMFDGLVLGHCQEPTLTHNGHMNSGALATRLGLTGMPSYAEAIILQRDLRLVEATGVRYHACHITCAESVDIMRSAKAQGLPVTCDVSALHFSLNELAVDGYRTFAKVNPPLRRESDRKALIAGLADGTIDAITSDHCPQDQDSKRVPFDQAAFGAIGFQTLLSLTLEVVHSQQLTMLQAMAALSSHPAAILRLQVGRLSPRSVADIVLFDPDVEYWLTEDAMTSKSKNTPLTDRPMRGKVLLTMKSGRIVYTG